MPSYCLLALDLVMGWAGAGMAMGDNTSNIVYLQIQKVETLRKQHGAQHTTVETADAILCSLQ